MQTGRGVLYKQTAPQWSAWAIATAPGSSTCCGAPLHHHLRCPTLQALWCQTADAPIHTTAGASYNKYNCPCKQLHSLGALPPIHHSSITLGDIEDRVGGKAYRQKYVSRGSSLVAGRPGKECKDMFVPRGDDIDSCSHDSDYTEHDADQPSPNPHCPARLDFDFITPHSSLRHLPTPFSTDRSSSSAGHGLRPMLRPLSALPLSS
ncbi:hypothetical protein V8E36_006156 [Tilletia maclaganii]